MPRSIAVQHAEEKLVVQPNVSPLFLSYCNLSVCMYVCMCVLMTGNASKVSRVDVVQSSAAFVGCLFVWQRVCFNTPCTLTRAVAYILSWPVLQLQAYQVQNTCQIVHGLTCTTSGVDDIAPHWRARLPLLDRRDPRVSPCPSSPQARHLLLYATRQKSNRRRKIPQQRHNRRPATTDCSVKLYVRRAGASGQYSPQHVCPPMAAYYGNFCSFSKGVPDGQKSLLLFQTTA